ncbi:hypothetical protein ACHAPT_006490 [Fusarium lateritium]
MNAVASFEECFRVPVGGLSRDPPSEAPSGLGRLLEECKVAARKIKSNRPTAQLMPRDLRHLVPAKKECDVLVDAYFRTFESVFRVLHRPTFQHEYERYWQDPPYTGDPFVVTLLLVLSIGSSFDRSLDDPRAFYDSSSWHWVHAAQLWSGAPLEKRHLTVQGLQIHCLLLLSLQMNGIGADLSWISSGSLLRAAMMIGLHREPSLLPGVSILEAEIRRRLWATILELVVQSALDCGMTPMISTRDYDCELPSNLNDGQIDESTETQPLAEPIHHFTQTSGQLAIARHLPIRLRIVEALNSFHSCLSYEDTLALGEQLANSCRSAQTMFQSFLANPSPSPGNGASAFQAKMVDLLGQRFLLSLHLPFALQAQSNLTYYYSRKVCIESAFLLMSFYSSRDENGDCCHLQILSRGLFKGLTLQAGIVICIELALGLSENNSQCSVTLDWNALHGALGQMVDTLGRRIKAGETSVKSYVLFSCALAQFDALRSGADVQSAILNTAKEKLEECLDTLKASMKHDQGTAEGSYISPLGGLDDNLSKYFADMESITDWYPFDWNMAS